MIARDKDGNIIGVSQDAVEWTMRTGDSAPDLATIEMTAEERSILSSLMDRGGHCATCRWAVPRRAGSGNADSSLSLLCTLAGGDDGYHGGQTWDSPPNAIFAVEGSEWSRLAVSPDFGCVQWEAKPEIPTFSGGAGHPTEKPQPLSPQSLVVKREYDGSAEIACPGGCGTVLHTGEAYYREQMPDGLRWVGVPCKTCGTSYTVELTKVPDV